jgi:TonB family protein
MEATDVLRDRRQPPAGLQKMISVSILFHGLLIAGVMFGPQGFMGRPAEAPRSVMTISIGGGGDGPQNGGLTSIGARPVQVATPPQETPKREAVRPPAARAPEMTTAVAKAKPIPAATSKVTQAPSEARGRTPTHGAEVRSGTAIAETSARGGGFGGLSTGGGPGSGSTLDVANFCCPDYLVLMLDRIRSAWDQHADTGGTVLVRFTIERDGKLTQVAVEKGSGYPTLDFAAQRAVVGTRQLLPLPAAFPNSTLTVHLNFEYQR